MAKYENSFQGDFDEFLQRLEDVILKGSSSASYENGSDYEYNGVRGAARVYERYSMVGSNRVSMSVMLIGHGSDLFVSVITAGGSQAVFFKINTIGEESFLRHAIVIIEEYIRNTQH